MKKILGLLSSALVAATSCSQGERGGSSGASRFPSDGGAGDCPHRCSRDLRSIVDCRDAVVRTCPTMEGCAPDAAEAPELTCIPACEAAKLNQSTIGCEYYAQPPLWFHETGGCYAVLLANVWDSPIDVDVEWRGQHAGVGSIRLAHAYSGGLAYDVLPGGRVPPGAVAVAFLAQLPLGEAFGIPCPEGALAPGYDYSLRNGVGQSFRITTSAPIVVSDIYPYGGARSFISSASLLLPTSAWGTNYLTFVGYPPSVNGLFESKSYLQFVARDDDTHVTLAPSMRLPAIGALPPVEPGQIQSYALQRGQLLQFAQETEMNGIAVESDKPISFVGGANCLLIPDGSSACDSIHQQLPPIQEMGHRYAAVRYRDRNGDNQGVDRERSLFRFLGMVDGTALAFEPPIEGAPSTISRGQMLELELEGGHGPFTVEAQDEEHPFLLSAIMPSCHYGNESSGCLGDPEYVVMVAIDQYLSQYTFLTDPTYPNTNLVFVRGPHVDGRYRDVALDCRGALDGWTRIGNSSYEYTRIDVVRNGTNVAGCSNGVLRAASDAPFGVTVWGFDQTVSYGYSAGMGTKPLNRVRAPAVVR